MRITFANIRNTFVILSLLADLIAVQRAAAQTFIQSSVLSVRNGPGWLTAADINGDGWLDLIVPTWLDDTGNRLGCCGGSLTVLTNNGNGTFTVSSTNAVRHPDKVVAADLNGDGWLDLVAANTDTNTVTVLTNNRNGTFTASSTNVVGLGPWAVLAADVNGDGKLDLITADRAWHLEPFPAGSTLTVLTNNGDGTFTLSATLAVGGSPSSVIAADLNGDGKLDLVSADDDDNSLSVLINNGTGSFTRSAILPVGTGPHVVVAVDVNGDGMLDLVNGNTFSNTLTVHTNNGNGTFKLSSTLAVGNHPYGFVAADINGDGKMDLISGSGDGNTLTVLTNNGSGTFEHSATLSVGRNPFYVVAADVNRDGKVDLVSANFSDNTLTVLLNSPAPPSLDLRLADANTLLLSWSAAWPGFKLQQNSDLGTTNWVSVTNSVQTIAGKSQVLVAPPRENNFYRLFHP